RAVVSGFATTVLSPRNPRDGAPAHLAPEAARGARPSSASDIFALGAMLYSAVEGRDPFPAGDHVVTLPQRAGLLRDLLVPMLHPDPGQRPSAIAVVGALGQLSAAPSAQPPTVTWSAVTPTSATYPASAAIGLATTQRAFGPPAGGSFTPGTTSGPGPASQ